MEELIEVGKIINTHGLRGEVKVTVWMNNIEDFESLPYVYASPQNDKLNVSGIKYQKNNLIVKFKEINDIDEAQKFKNSVLLAVRDMIDIDEDEHFIADIIGLDVIDEATGEKIGTISDVFNTGSNDIYDVKRDGKKNLLLPVIDDVVREINIENGTVTVHMMEGLDDEI